MPSKVALIVIILSIFNFFRGFSQTKKTSPSASDSIDIFLKASYPIIKEKALYKEKVNWDDFDQRLSSLKKSADKFSEILPFFSEVFEVMEDNHSFLVHNNKEYASSYKGFDESKIREPLIKELEKGRVRIKTKKFKNGEVGYIQVPNDNTSDKFDAMQKSSQVLQDSLCSLASDNLKGVIVDLRLNGGGNMYPMITGLSNLIGEGKFGSVINEKIGKKEDWEVKENGTYSDGKLISELRTSCTDIDSNLKVAVILSQITASSGEITALAFYKRDKSKFFGESTAGYMTANELYYLPFESYLLLAEGYETDREGNVLKFIKPDVEMIEGDNFTDLAKDLKVKAAIKWILDR